MSAYPNFFVVGAPKCGTTSLSTWLDGHPRIYMSPVKEPHFFSTDLASRTVRSSNSYKKLFRSRKSEHSHAGEASTWYLFSDVAVPAIERQIVDAKYIVMTRDPVDMFLSLHHHNCRVLHEDQHDAETAWYLQGDRALGHNIPKTCTEPAFLQYRAACSLGTLVERLYARVPKERVLLIPLERMRTEPGYGYRRVLGFLGVEDDAKTDFAVENVARGTRSVVFQRLLRMGARIRTALGFYRGFGLGRLNEVPLPKGTISDEFRLLLESEFAEECRKLEDIILLDTGRQPPVEPAIVAESR